MTNVSPLLPKPRYTRTFFVAWLIYMVAALSDHYDGILTWIGQPIMGAIFGGIVVGLVVLLGLVLQVPAIGRTWYGSRWLPLVLLVAGVFLLMFGRSLGLSETYRVEEFASVDPEFQVERHRLHAAVAIPAFMIVVFAVAYGSRTKTPQVDDLPAPSPS